MNLPLYVLRNMTGRGYRTVTMGFYVFVIALVMTFSGSVSLAVQKKTDLVLTSGFTRHIQVRSNATVEDDMVSQYTGGMDAIAVIPGATVASIRDIVSLALPDAGVSFRVRQNVHLAGKTRQEESLLIGLDPADPGYREAFIITTGSYLAENRHSNDGDPDSGALPEILLTIEQARKLDVLVGDTVPVLARNNLGRNSRISARVAGIGDFILLSLFSYKAVFMDIRDARNLLALDPVECTDILLTLPSGDEAESAAGTLCGDLAGSGIQAQLTRDMKLESDDLGLASLDDLKDNGDEKLVVSTYGEMGDLFRNTGNVASVSLMALTALLMGIAGILMANVASAGCMERFREIGTIRAFGFPRHTVIMLLTVEIAWITAAAAAGGMLLCSIFILIFGRGMATPPGAVQFIMGKTLDLEIDPAFMFPGFLLILLYAVTATAIPVLRAASVNPRQSLDDRA